MLGSTFAIWNDNIDTAAQGISEVDNFERFEDALPILASKGWGEGEDLEFAAVKEKAEKLGDHPEEVSVNEKNEGRTIVLELHVAEGDMGKVIGKQGRIAKAIRSVVKAAATKEDKKVVVDIV